jgi:RNA polymerase sigma-70 factor (sigma-E family)
MENEFEEFVRARTPALLRSAFLLTGDQQLAEDLVQSALARTHRSWKRLERVGNAEAYTRKTMYHLQVGWWQRRRFIEVGLDGADRALRDGSELAASRIDLRRALLRLAPRQRAVIVLRFFEDQTEAEAARTLDCSVGTIKSQTSKALARLRQIMAVEEVIPQ